MRTTIVELSASDRAVVAAVLAGLSDESRRRRFHRPVPVVDGPLLDLLADVDGRDHVAAAAWVGRNRIRRGRPVGSVRLVRTGPNRGELAVEVVDAAQGRGVGRRLLAWAREAAVDRGMPVVEAHVLSDNMAMRRLFTSIFPGAFARSDGRVVSFEWHGDWGSSPVDAAVLVGRGAG